MTHITFATMLFLFGYFRSCLRKVIQTTLDVSLSHLWSSRRCSIGNELPLKVKCHILLYALPGSVGIKTIMVVTQEVSEQKQIGFHSVYQLRSRTLFVFSQKRRILWVTTITVFDTDRSVLLFIKLLLTKKITTARMVAVVSTNKYDRLKEQISVICIGINW